MATIEQNSFDTVFGETETAMVYGFNHCDYRIINHAASTQLQRVYNSSLGMDDSEKINVNPEDRQTLRGREIKQVRSGAQEAKELEKKEPTEKNSKRVISRYCKAALTSFLAENLRKAKRGKPLSKLVFCVDKEDNPFSFQAKDIFSNKENLVTHSEIRRAYKLCHDEGLSEEMRTIAKQSIVFVKVSEKRSSSNSLFPSEFILTPIPAPWEQEDVQPYLKERQAQTASEPKPGKGFSWKEDIKKIEKEYANLRPKQKSLMSRIRSMFV